MRYTCDAIVARISRRDRNRSQGTLLASDVKTEPDSSRSHRVLGRTMSSRRSPPRGNSGGFAFNVVANPAAVLPAVLDEDLVGVEPGRKDARDVDPRHVGLHGGWVVPGHARRVVDLGPERAKPAQIDRKSKRLNSSHSQNSNAAF